MNLTELNSSTKSKDQESKLKDDNAGDESKSKQSGSNENEKSQKNSQGSIFKCLSQKESNQDKKSEMKEDSKLKDELEIPLNEKDTENEGYEVEFRGTITLKNKGLDKDNFSKTKGIIKISK